MNTITWQEYCSLAAKTESIPTNHYGKLIGDAPVDLAIHTRATRLLHAAMGLVTETQELADATSYQNFAEELGDCFWYLPIIESALGRPLNFHSTFYIGAATAQLLLSEMQTLAAELLNLVGKRHIFYGKPLEVSAVLRIADEYASTLYTLVLHLGLTLNDVLSANIAKLAKRYPKGTFDSTDAVVRDVKAELSHIPGSALPAPIPAPDLVLDRDPSVPVELPLTPELEEGLEAMAAAAPDPWPSEANRELVEAYISEETSAATYNEMFDTVEEEAFKLETMGLTPSEYTQFVTGMVMDISTHYRKMNANALAEGFKRVYLALMEEGMGTTDAFEIYKLAKELILE